MRTVPRTKALSQGKTLKIVLKTLEKYFNPLPDDRILDWSKLKAFADSILKCIRNEN